MTALPELSVVLPVYREAEHIESSLSVIDQTLAALDMPYEIICVDDGSPDQTWEALDRCVLSFSSVRAIKLSRNFGKEYAVLAGLESSVGQAVVVMDCDLQHPPSVIPEMVRLWRSGKYKVIDGVKRKANRRNRLAEYAARNFYRTFRLLTKADLQNSSDFKLLDRAVVDAYLGLPERQLFFRGLVSWMGYSRTSVEFEVADRTAGESKFSAKHLIALATDSIIGFSEVLLQTATVVGGLFLLFSMGIAVHTIYQYLTGNAVEGFATVILIQLLIGAAMMLAMGVIGLYIASIHRELKSRPRYLVEFERGGESLRPELSLNVPETDLEHLTIDHEHANQSPAYGNYRARRSVGQLVHGRQHGQRIVLHLPDQSGRYSSHSAAG
ncbi:glycosyltransferase family 2 protein [Rhodopirellula sp. MGV]|uniref:glycosyltransferase family 2 protein n=1 Tax=Rhodopirellula sp. MGV TaxID=2023130 RepID=UPI000B96DD29|nr:glycosyltransferase family 2 protein [Rhodopirellula sp. MGV]OYP38920.1 hypothetical protein CGZ80_01490 [Rhodopirellula sp. MGV]PNY37598.1 glycosyltransferase [Rhodopirellula baltica]